MEDNQGMSDNDIRRKLEEAEQKIAEITKKASDMQSALVSSEIERSDLKKDNLKLNKQLKEEKEKNARLEHNGIQRNVKDSVFTHLFSIKEYSTQLYKELFPNDSAVSEDDIKLFTLSSVLTNQMYNDLGILIRDILIVLVEAQSTWSENIIFRLVGYYYNSVIKYIREHNQSVYGKKTVSIPKVKAFVVYSGDEEIAKPTLSLRDVFYGGDDTQPEFFATVIHTKNGTGILGEYIGFCEELNTQTELYPDDSEKAVLATIEICIQEGFLAQYLKDHRKEVYDIMAGYFRTLKLDRDELAQRSFVQASLHFNISDELIRDALIEEYSSLSEEEAEALIQFVREHPDRSDW